MSSSSLFLTTSGAFLAIASVCTALYSWIVYRRVQKLLNRTPVPPFGAPAPTPYLNVDTHQKRTREIAIIAPVRRRSTAALVDQFTETMREHGSLLYHFTYHWGNGSIQTMHSYTTEIVQKKKYDAIITYGTASTFAAKQASLTYGSHTPIVFLDVRDTSWEASQAKNPTTHITGVVCASIWKTRIKMYLAAKPSLRSVLIPHIGNGKILPDIEQIKELLSIHHITTYVVQITDARDIPSLIPSYADKVDSIIIPRIPIKPEICKQIAAACAHNNITFFSSHLADIQYGAAMAVSTSDEKIGYKAAKKVLAILEEGKLPQEIPISHINETHPHEAHFNQVAMREQGLDPVLLTTFALQHASRVNVSLTSTKSDIT